MPVASRARTSSRSPWLAAQVSATTASVWVWFFLRRGSRLVVRPYPVTSESNACTLYSATSLRQNSMPRTELPSSSSRGDHTAMPISPGTTSMTAPDTPLLAGSPMVNANSPEKSYMPQDDIIDRQDCTAPGVNTASSVSGQTPALASDAAATACIWVSTSIEQAWK